MSDAPEATVQCVCAQARANGDPGDCEIHVGCDIWCGALEDPVSPEEIRAALEHWRYHPYACGCSRAR